VLTDRSAYGVIQGVVALARQGPKSLQPKLLAALDRFVLLTDEDLKRYGVPTPGAEVPADALFAPGDWMLDLLRAYQLVFMRMGEPDKETATRLAKKFDPHFPAKSEMLNRELCSMLVYLKSPTIVAKCIELMKQPSKPLTPDDMAALLARNRGYGGTIAKMLANSVDQQKFYYAFALRNVRDGWTMEQRKFYFQFLDDCRQKSGGASFQGFINNTEKDAFANATDAERLAIEALGLRKPYRPKELPKPVGPGRDWKLDELVKFTEPKLKGRNFKNGAKMYAAARCVVCHRFQGDGGATGPDLSQVAGRFNLKDLCESIVEPSKVISDQYKASIVSTKQGKDYTGRIVAQTPTTLTMLLDPEDSTKVVEIKLADVEEQKASPVSTMPADLLKALNDNEVLDLLAYLLSRGDPGHPMFKK
jgi:putative heme-binding domain-containing protein